MLRLRRLISPLVWPGTSVMTGIVGLTLNSLLIAKDKPGEDVPIRAGKEGT